jgi:starch-binding outer membrane protein, SusD/RagB family
MKKTTIKLTLAGLLCVGIYNSCSEKNLDLQPQALTEASYFTQELDFDRAVRGVYAKLTDYYWFNNNSPIHGVWQLPGDDITTLGTDASERFIDLNPANGASTTFYRVSYQLVGRANVVLQKNTEVADGVYTTANLRNHHRGEALFLRAFAYFNLWNFYGTSPLVSQRIQTTDAINPPGSTGTQLIDQAIADLQEAARLLPASWDNANRGRVTASSANGLLGKALVFRGTIARQPADFTAAIAAFSAIRDRQLMPNFADNFLPSTENNAESLFEFQASQPGFDNVWLSNDFDNAVGSTSAYWGLYENHWSLFGRPPFVGTQKLADAFEAGDPRRAVTLGPGNVVRKYVTGDQKTQSGVASLNNPRLLRYADVLLLQAEAIVMSNGSLSDAIGLVNRVRARARGTGAVPADRSLTESNRDRVMEWIMNERFVELAGEEGGRWLDLRRWHLAGRINLNSFNFGSVRDDVRFADRNLYYPIPLAEVDLNPNVPQNPGY